MKVGNGRWGNNIFTYNREDIDLRKSHPGWDKAGYNDNDWELAKLLRAQKEFSTTKGTTM